MQKVEKIYPPGIFDETGIFGECTEPQTTKRGSTQFFGKLVTRVERDFGTRPYQLADLL